jgi:hypothetical protein
MKTIIFAGQTISEEEAGRILDAIYLPPVSQSDLVSAVHDYKPDVIGIIDGMVGDELSVWHSEILYAMNNGIAVYGSGGIGALRAVAMEHLGMIGIGEIYEKYKKEELNDDDEAIAACGSREEGYPRLSEPMVNLRETFEGAVGKGVIDDSLCKKLIAVAKSIYYPERTFPLIFQKAEDAGISKATTQKLRNFVSDNYIDILKLDAIKLLNTIGSLSEADIKPAVKKEFKGIAKRIFDVTYNRDRKVQHNDIDIPLYYIGNYVGIKHPKIEDINFHALNRMLALFLADMLRVRVSEEDIDKEGKRFRKKHSLEDEKVFSKWLPENDLSAGEFNELMKDIALIRRLHRWFLTKQIFKKNTKAILDELRLENQYKEWKAKTADREKIVRGKTEEVPEILDKEDLRALLKDYIGHTGFRWNTDILEAASETGFDRGSLKNELVKEKIFRETLDKQLKKLFLDD